MRRIRRTRGVRRRTRRARNRSRRIRGYRVSRGGVRL